MQLAQSEKLVLYSKQSTKASHLANSDALSNPQYEFVRITPGNA